MKFVGLAWISLIATVAHGATVVPRVLHAGTALWVEPVGEYWADRVADQSGPLRGVQGATYWDINDREYYGIYTAIAQY